MTAPADPQALKVGQLAQRLWEEYLAFVTLIESAKHPESVLRVPPAEHGHRVGLGHIYHKDGTPISFWYEYYLTNFRALLDQNRREADRVWLSGALITLGDALADATYFDHAPELELVRHMRNAVAHGNRFHITRAIPHPAHNRLAIASHSPESTEYEITPSLHGQSFLFDWMEPGDVVDVFQHVSIYLIRMGNGDQQLRP